MVLSILKGAANAATGGLMNMALSGHEDARQAEQQKKLTDQQVAAAKEMGTFNLGQSLSMLKAQDKARLQGIKEAGLSPGLMYGGSGAGGQTISAGAMPTGGNAGDANSAVANSAHLGMIKANTDLAEAQAAKATAEAEKIKGVDTQEAQTNIDFNRLRNEIQGQTLYQQMDAIIDAGRKLRTEALVGENTAPQQIEKTNLELTNLALEAVAKDKGIQLDTAKINEISNNIQQKWKELSIKETTNRWEHEDRLKSIEEYTKTALYAAGINAAGNIVGDVVKIATRQPMSKGKSVETVGRDGKSHYEYTQYH